MQVFAAFYLKKAVKDSIFPLKPVIHTLFSTLCRVLCYNIYYNAIS